MTLTTLRRAALMAAVAGLPLAACSNADQAAVSVQSAAQAQVNPTLSTTDTTFLNEAARAGGDEVSAGQLAQKKGYRASTRRFAAQMVSEHEAADQKLLALAQTKQITPSATPDEAHATALQQMQALRGRAFDKAYLDAQVADHQHAISLYQNEATNGTDPDVKAFAAQNEPLLEQHLAEAQRLDPRR